MVSDREDGRSAEQRAAWEIIKRVSTRRLASERRRSWTPTDLAMETWLRLQRQRGLDWRSADDVRCSAVREARRLLVEQARRSQSLRRGGVWRRCELSEETVDRRLPDPAVVLSVNDLLQRLAATDREGAACIEMRYFGGYTVQEIADQRGCSIATAERALKAAREWVASRVERADFFDGP